MFTPQNGAWVWHHYSSVGLSLLGVMKFWLLENRSLLAEENMLMSHLQMFLSFFFGQAVWIRKVHGVPCDRWMAWVQRPASNMSGSLSGPKGLPSLRAWHIYIGVNASCFWRGLLSWDWLDIGGNRVPWILGASEPPPPAPYIHIVPDRQEVDLR